MITIICLITIMVFSPLSTALSAGSKNTPDKKSISYVVPGQIVIKLAQTGKLNKSSLDDRFSANGIQELTPVTAGFKILQKKNLRSLERIYFARIPLDADPLAISKKIGSLNSVEYAEPLYYHFAMAIPNDPLFSQQSFFDVIEVERAWDVVKGGDGNVVIATIDGGTDIDHPDLMGSIWTNPGEIPDNNVDDDNNGFIDDIHGWNFANDSNDPSGLASTPSNADHGTHTAGLAAATTDNGIGVAGASWNASIMAINISSNDEDLALIHLTKGILYAINSGADIISMSLGHASGASAFEQELINTATEMGIAVIAAAGNDNQDVPNFPAAYDNVLSVGATDNTDLKARFSNYGPTVDIMAPGLQILSTLNDGLYGQESGTSMSAPIVAGIAALLLTQHPDWTGVQALEQLRVTADDIDDLNPLYQGQLGFGRANARRAVTETWPSVRLSNVQFIDSNQDGIIQPGEQVQVMLSIKNYLAASEPLTLTINHSDQYANLPSNTLSHAGLSTLEEVTLQSFIVEISEAAPSGHPINFSVQIDAGSYHDRDSFKLTVLPTFGNLAGNNVGLTVTNVGRIGFGDPNDTESGIGFSFENGPNLLFEGALIMGTGPDQVSNAARTENGYDSDFQATSDGEVQIITPGSIADQESICRFDDSKAANPMNIKITQETFASQMPENADFVIFRYNVENLGQATIQNFHFGIFFDWDIDSKTFATNIVGVNEAKRLGYAFDSGAGPDTWVGVSVLTDGDFSFMAIQNDEFIYDNFTDTEKWQSISGGVQSTTAGPADVSFSIGAGPFTIEPTELQEIVFAILGGDNQTDLLLNADRAKAYWESVIAAVEDRTPLPTAFSLSQNYPNPFNPSTEIAYDLSESGEVKLTIFNLMGQVVRVLLDGKQSRGHYSVRWDGRDQKENLLSTGLYIYRLETHAFVKSKRMLFLK